MKRLAALIAVLGLMAQAAVAQQAASRGTGAKLRGLDKITGQVSDFELRNGEAARWGRVTIRLMECRYPRGAPAADGFALLRIEEQDREAPVFTGWMVASSPALNALDHARYDVWVLRCITK